MLETKGNDYSHVMLETKDSRLIETYLASEVGSSGPWVIGLDAPGFEGKKQV